MYADRRGAGPKVDRARTLASAGVAVKHSAGVVARGLHLAKRKSALAAKLNHKPHGALAAVEVAGAVPEHFQTSNCHTTAGRAASTTLQAANDLLWTKMPGLNLLNTTMELMAPDYAPKRNIDRAIDTAVVGVEAPLTGSLKGLNQVERYAQTAPAPFQAAYAAGKTKTADQLTAEGVRQVADARQSTVGMSPAQARAGMQTVKRECVDEPAAAVKGMSHWQVLKGAASGVMTDAKEGFDELQRTTRQFKADHPVALEQVRKRDAP